jgi:FixJ family two-component response regulator
MTPHADLIAIVDDDDNLRQLLKDLVARFGFRSELFASAGEFLAAASTCQAGCLLLDVNIGEDCGLDLASILAARGHSFPIIFMTASMSAAVRRRAIDLGCVAYLEKPFKTIDLVQAINTAIAPKPTPSMMV